jgi:uncharacterized protein
VSIELLLSSGASFFAGLIDSIVGGGGLILVPALFSIYPDIPPATLLGTNKCAGLSGTLISATHYARRVELPWSWLLPASVAAFVGALLGAWTVTQVDPSFLRKLLPFLLTAVLVYTFVNRNLGLHHAPTRSHRKTLVIAATAGACIGWYDGFFGPGTGSFFIFLFVRGLGFDFLNASASAKVMNVATNLAAFGLLAMRGHVWWQVGIAIAVANIAGSLVGTRIALRSGPGLIRKVFLVVVTALIIKTARDAFFA